MILYINLNLMSKWYLLTLLILQLTISSACLEIHEQQSEQKDSRIKIKMYYSSMCYFSKKYLRRNIQNAVKVPEIWKAVDFKLIPYGITSRRKNGNQWEFDCMHGPSQCRGNKIHTCAIKLYQQEYYTKAMAFVGCMAHIERGWDWLGMKCAEKVGVSWEKIDSCSKSDEGVKYLLQMAQETEKLSPKNTYVPWITVNQSHSQVVETDDLDEYVCRRYKGPQKLKFCKRAKK